MRRILRFLPVFLLFLPRAEAATLPEDVQTQLSSQTNVYAKTEPEPVKRVPEKPEIVVEEDDRNATLVDEGPEFFVKTIEVLGNTAIPSKTFTEMKAPYENRQSSFARLREFSEAVTAVYRSQGYITSRGYIPPQTVEGGVINVSVLEGRIGSIFVEGNKWFDAGTYRRYMDFPATRVFRYQDLERSLFRLNRQPDRNVKAFLIAGEKLGSSDIILKVKDSNPFHMHYDFNNRGTKFTHRARHGLTLSHNNITGRDDALSITATGAEEGAFQGGFFSYSTPMHDMTWVKRIFSVSELPFTLNLSGGNVETNLIGSLAPQQIRGESLNFAAGLTYAIVDRPDAVIEGYFGFNYVNSESEIAGDRTSIDRVRSLRFGPRMTFQDAGGRTSISSDVRLGLPGVLQGLDERDADASVRNSGNDFSVVAGNIARVQRLPFGMYTTLRAGGQWTKDILNSVEQYRAGGASTVRGYLESEAAGDYGWLAGAELNFPIFFMPPSVKIPTTKRTWYDSLRFVTFVDASKTYLYEKRNAASVKDKFLVGAGFGMRLELADYVWMSADMAWPIGDDSNDPNNGQLHLSARAGF